MVMQLYASFVVTVLLSLVQLEGAQAKNISHYRESRPNFPESKGL